MTVALSRLDLAVIAVYLLGMAVAGSLFYRRGADTKEFFLANRAVSWLPLGICIIATDFSAVTYLGSPAFVYQRNLQGLPVNFVQALVVLLLVVPLIVPFYHRLNVFTSYEYLEQRFDSRVRTVAGCLFLLLRSAYLGIVIYAPSLVIAEVTAFPLPASVLFMGVLTTAYAALGGMRAIIWTDVLQFVTIVVGLAALVYCAIAGIEGDWAGVWRTANDLGKTRIMDFSLDLREEFTFWSVLLGGAVLFLNNFGADQITIQRYMTAKSTAECQNALRLKAAVSVSMALCLAGIGILLAVYYSQHPAEASQIRQRDAVLPYFAVSHLPSGLPGLVIASLFAAAMSTLSGGINSLTTVSMVDFYKRLWSKDRDEAHYMRVSRLITVFWGGLATAAALFANRLGELFMAYNKVNSYLGGVILAIFLLGMLTRRATGTATLIGAAVGLSVVVAVSLTTSVSWLWYGVVGCTTTFATGFVLSPRQAAGSEEHRYEKAGRTV